MLLLATRSSGFGCGCPDRWGLAARAGKPDPPPATGRAERRRTGRLAAGAERSTGPSTDDRGRRTVLVTEAHAAETHRGGRRGRIRRSAPDAGTPPSQPTPVERLRPEAWLRIPGSLLGQRLERAPRRGVPGEPARPGQGALGQPAAQHLVAEHRPSASARSAGVVDQQPRLAVDARRRRGRRWPSRRRACRRRPPRSASCPSPRAASCWPRPRPGGTTPPARRRRRGPAGSIQSAAPSSSRSASRRRPLVALADDDRPQLGVVGLHLGQGAEQDVEALDRHQPPDGHDQRRRASAAARACSAASTPGGATRDPLGAQAEHVDDLAPRGLRQRDDPARAGRSGGATRRSTRSPSRASIGGRTMPHISACTWCRKTMRGPAVPQRREEGHAVPDLDQRVAGAVPHADALPGRTGEHGVAAGLAQHPVAVAGRARPVPRDGRGAEGDVEAGGGPARRDHVGVQLGAARLGVVEVTPGDEVDAADARPRRRWASTSRARSAS